MFPALERNLEKYRFPGYGPETGRCNGDSKAAGTGALNRRGVVREFIFRA